MQVVAYLRVSTERQGESGLQMYRDDVRLGMGKAQAETS